MLRHRRLALISLVLIFPLGALSAPAQKIDAHATGSTPTSMTPSPSSGLPAASSAVTPQSPGQSHPGSYKAPNSGPLSSEEQIEQQEHQRVFGVMAAFNTTANRDALPMTPAQKFQLFFRSQTDPWPFALAAVAAGLGQAQDNHHEYGQGLEGYLKRYSAAYGDAFIGNFFGNAVLPTLWNEDPRFFQMGTGRVASRALWAATATVWCRRDNGSWGPNYSNLIGNLIGSAIANVYYPASERTATDTITRSLTVSAEGIVGAEVIEFWPDIARHFRNERAEKAARREALADARAAQTAGQHSSHRSSPAPAPQQ